MVAPLGPAPMQISQIGRKMRDFWKLCACFWGWNIADGIRRSCEGLGSLATRGEYSLPRQRFVEWLDSKS